MITSKDFLEMARSLVGDSDYENEASYRTVIGRAYYACFLYFCNNLGLDPSKPDLSGKKSEIHKKVIETLRDAGRKTEGDKLFLMRRDRTDSDYCPNEDITKTKAEDAIILADELMV